MEDGVRGHLFGFVGEDGHRLVEEPPAHPKRLATFDETYQCRCGRPFSRRCAERDPVGPLQMTQVDIGREDLRIIHISIKAYDPDLTSDMVRCFRECLGQESQVSRIYNSNVAAQVSVRPSLGYALPGVMTSRAVVIMSLFTVRRN